MTRGRRCKTAAVGTAKFLA